MSPPQRCHSTRSPLLRARFVVSDRSVRQGVPEGPHSTPSACTERHSAIADGADTQGGRELDAYGTSRRPVHWRQIALPSGYPTTPKSFQTPGTPLSSCSPRSSNSMPEPVSRPWLAPWRFWPLPYPYR